MLCGSVLAFLLSFGGSVGKGRWGRKKEQAILLWSVCWECPRPGWVRALSPALLKCVPGHGTGWEWDCPQGPFNPNHSVILWHSGWTGKADPAGDLQWLSVQQISADFFLSFSKYWKAAPMSLFVFIFILTTLVYFYLGEWNSQLSLGGHGKKNLPFYLFLVEDLGVIGGISSWKEWLVTPGSPEPSAAQWQPGWAHGVSILLHFMVFKHNVTQQPPAVWEHLDSSSASSLHCPSWVLPFTHSSKHCARACTQDTGFTKWYNHENWAILRDCA